MSFNPFPIGTQLHVETCFGDQFTGEVVTYEHSVKMLILSCPAMDAKGNNCRNQCIINLDFCKDLHIVQESKTTPPDILAGTPSRLNLQHVCSQKSLHLIFSWTCFFSSSWISACSRQWNSASFCCVPAMNSLHPVAVSSFSSWINISATTSWTGNWTRLWCCSRWWWLRPIAWATLAAHATVPSCSIMCTVWSRGSTPSWPQATAMICQIRWVTTAHNSTHSYGGFRHPTRDSHTVAWRFVCQQKHFEIHFSPPSTNTLPFIECTTSRLVIVYTYSI